QFCRELRPRSSQLQIFADPKFYRCNGGVIAIEAQANDILRTTHPTNLGLYRKVRRSGQAEHDMKMQRVENRYVVGDTYGHPTFTNLNAGCLKLCRGAGHSYGSSKGQANIATQFMQQE